MKSSHFLNPAIALKYGINIALLIEYINQLPGDIVSYSDAIMEFPYITEADLKVSIDYIFYKGLVDLSRKRRAYKVGRG